VRKYNRYNINDILMIANNSYRQLVRLWFLVSIDSLA